MAFSVGFAFVAPALLALAGQGPGPAQTGQGYAGSKACMTECHIKEGRAFAETSKGKLFLEHPRTDLERKGCEGCHGPGAKHIESGGDDLSGMTTFGKKSKTPVAERNAFCLQCHEKTARMLWQGSSHESRDVACTSCHSVMQNASETGSLAKPTVLQTCGQCHAKQKAAALRSTHMPLGEVKLECTSCHNPHGSANPKLLLASSTNEACYTCHSEKRGPFLWEHAPVVENCANCHDPHGSNHEKMLKLSRPRLCQQCHQGTGHPQQPRATVTSSTGVVSALPADIQFLMNRQCSNCHFNIHGSNHPSGQAFTR
jgi:DmsE family decaheme c-type cytochrome